MAENNRVMVLGSNGFIGMHLVSQLRSQNYHVVGVDRNPGVVTPVSGLAAPDEFYPLNLPDQRFEDILQETKPSAIVNASGPASVAYSFHDPRADFSGSVDVCFFILETMRKTLPDCRFLFLSSAAVYGNPTSLPVKETDPLRPISPYGYNKQICELLLQEYFSVYGLKTSILRIFSAYGPGLKKQILWDLYLKSMKNERVDLFGTGDETRDFIFVQDLACAIQLILEQGVFHADIYNVANGHEVTIKTLAQLFLSSLKIEKEMHFSGETKVGDPKKWCADIEKIMGLGYAPKVSLEQGVFAYANWLKETEAN